MNIIAYLTLAYLTLTGMKFIRCQANLHQANRNLVHEVQSESRYTTNLVIPIIVDYHPACKFTKFPIVV